MKTMISESQILADIYSKVQERFAGVDDLAHGWEHIQRVYTMALHLAEQEGANFFIVGMAALMHDLGRVAHDDTKHHADLSAMLAADMMAEYDIVPEVEQAILHAITAHSFSRGMEPRTLEARVVRDADRLDGLGAIGILRWAITGTNRHAPSTLTYHPDDPFAEYHIPDDEKYMLDHFFTKLLKLGDSMATETGRGLAERRTAFIRVYLDELKGELEM